MSTPRRIIDANANRAREALRVLEDAARFLLDDTGLTTAAKSLRHDITETIAPLGDCSIDRDTPGDVGTSVRTEGEQERRSTQHVVIAAARRLGEALRAIEEYTKLVQPAIAPSVEAIRYRGYDLEQRLRRALKPARSAQWRLCTILTEAACVRPWRDVALATLDGGADCVQLREKSVETAELLDRAAWLVEVAHGRADVIVNDRLDVALAAGAAGVHLGQRDLPCGAAERIAGDRLAIGISTSGVEDARRARDDGADYCGIGPMFPTTTKHKPVLAGPDALRGYLTWDGRPHLAIGGITLENVGALVACGARGIAVCAVVCGAEDPEGVTAELVGAMTEG